MIKVAAILIFVICLALPAFAAKQSAVVREDGKVYIKDIDRLAWGKGQDCTFMGALTALAHHMGSDVSYDYLMGVSGAAFKIHSWTKGWCPSSAVAGPGYHVTDNALKALGYSVKDYAWYQGKPLDDVLKTIKAPIVKSINSGVPVIFENMDDGLIVGYTDDNKLICRTYFDKDGEYTVVKDSPWWILVVTGRSNPLDKKQAVKNSLSIAIELAETPEFNEYKSGSAAYEKWIKDLQDDSKPADDGVIHANAFIYASLCDARHAAARYLATVQNELGTQSQKHLKKASGLYYQVAKKLDSERKSAPFPWELKDGKKWTKEMRETEAQVLQEVIELEKTAVSELKEALKAAD